MSPASSAMPCQNVYGGLRRNILPPVSSCFFNLLRISLQGPIFPLHIVVKVVRHRIQKTIFLVGALRLLKTCTKCISDIEGREEPPDPQTLSAKKKTGPSSINNNMSM
ncbi:hypothetical protein MPTK1_2g21510 [Marchantia polymorpha subsp. ruderalis]|uniref:Uncharacterized protein n=1 Tax=Marchantia polymorpha TaxID=3197 RepID=A0A2R6X2Q0_MARPO|nr:hypothetical protein MARPO_0040s0063 [Marchantia polymorpha]BBN03194.1 hypothetical protein Mp_2g21510 [Marchantia polymorpha subsp. ruderalis]|eukprot:PTQ40383.1 hypothetical protein MARPO_0040s0063 [Marchantia polymorpha]